MTNGTVLEKDWIFQDIDEKNIQSLSFLTELDYIFCKILNCKKITSENIQDWCENLNAKLLFFCEFCMY